MSSETILNNYSDDSQIKRYIIEKLAPQVFHNIPLNVLNTGEFSLINEYISQATEQMAFTSSFYLNESFITKSILPDSIYAEAAIFGIGYAFATPSCTNLLLELKLDDIYKNAKENVNGFMEFILDKNTKFNLSNGNVYSLDYDISIQFKDVKSSRVTAPIPAWDVKYINTDEMNSIAVNKTIYIPYRVTDQWLCLFVNVSEFERQTYTIPCNMANGIANEDRVITCRDHICGFDIKYVKSDGSYQYIPHDHILPMHSVVEDSDPYVHYIMDNQQSVRFMFQLQGNNFFKPELNSSYEITMYTCHGKAANFTKYDETDQPKVLTSGRRYSNNGNVLKAAFVIGASLGGTNIGTAESVRRKTIEAYNTANVLSTDHDIDEWLKTFYFENVLYPFFFKRRDDPWGRIWSGYLALKDSDDYVFRTNTLHAQISYDQLYNKYQHYKNQMLPNIDEGIAAVKEDGKGINFLKTKSDWQSANQAIADAVPEDAMRERILGDLVDSGDLVLLVMPQDIQAPKGRLILPQVQTIRELLDRKCTVVSTTADGLDRALGAVSRNPDLIITDSQCFGMVYEKKPADTPLTSFSILLAASKGDISAFLEGAAALDAAALNAAALNAAALNAAALSHSGQGTAASATQHPFRVLIAEACTHVPLNEDIGSVKIPRLLKKSFGESVDITNVRGNDFPSSEELKDYDLIIHCGACMFNRQHVMSRIAVARQAGVPITNYGIFLAWANGILDKVTL